MHGLRLLVNLENFSQLIEYFLTEHSHSANISSHFAFRMSEVGCWRLMGRCSSSIASISRLCTLQIKYFATACCDGRVLRYRLVSQCSHLPLIHQHPLRVVTGCLHRTSLNNLPVLTCWAWLRHPFCLLHRNSWSHRLERCARGRLNPKHGRKYQIPWFHFWCQDQSCSNDHLKTGMNQVLNVFVLENT